MPATKQPRGLFITGTDTGVGKTLVAAGLAKYLASQGHTIGVMKPAETGVQNLSQLGPDGELLKWAANSALSIEQICPYRLREPLAPAVAAAQEKLRIDYSHLVDQAQSIITEHDFTIIEGAGGLMVPLAGGLLIADFARAVNLPLLVVCRPGLGTINHTLLTLLGAKYLEIPVAGYLVNNMPANQSLAEETVAHTLASLTGEELLGVIQATTGTEQQKVQQIAEQFVTLPTLSLLKSFLPTAN